MSNEKLTFTIGGREALPVRAIPYVTGWQMSPDVVARSMARVEPPSPFPALLHGLSAYHLPDDTPVEVMPREWDATVATLEGYEAELKQQHPDDATGYAVWRKDSAEKLPAGAFVWLDEFARERTADRARVLKGKQRRGDDELILAPMLDEATRAMVREGFGPRKLHAANNPQDEATKRGNLIGWYDMSMHAAMWLKRASVKPGEAAMLLWRLDPLERDWRGDAPDPERTYVDGDETSPDHYRVLKRAFDDVAETDPKPRTLLDWRDVANREGLRYHKWIDDYVQARIEELPADSGSKGETATVGTGDTAKPEWVRQAWEIGTEWMLAEEKRTKKRPGIVEIAKYLEGEFKRRDIRSKRLDDYLNWQSIKKEITGITGRKPGDNFKSAMGNPQRKKHSPNVRAQ